jgi:regulator of sigma E protease
VQKVVSTSVGQPLAFAVKRGEKVVDVTVTPELREMKDEGGQAETRVAIGIVRKATPDSVHTHQPGVIEAVGLGFDQTKFIITSTLGYLHDVVVGHQRADQFGGVVRIADIAGKVAKKSVIDLIFLTGFISVSVGLINLFPIPLLDGGHLMFYAAEAVRGRPLSERTQEIGFRIGLAVVLMLMVFATMNDLPILKRWLSWIG